MRSGSAADGRMRFALGLTIVGAASLIAGLTMMLVGETLRLRSANSQGLVQGGEIAAICGLACGVAVLAVLAVVPAGREGRRGGPARGTGDAAGSAGGPLDPARVGLISPPSHSGPVPLPPQSAVPPLAPLPPPPPQAGHGWVPQAEEAWSPEADDEWDPHADGAWNPGPAYAWPEDDGADWDHGGAGDWATQGDGGWAPDGPGGWAEEPWAPGAHGQAPYLTGPAPGPPAGQEEFPVREPATSRGRRLDGSYQPVHAEPPSADTQEKIEQIKDLYLTAEAIGEAGLGRHFEELKTRQQSLIREFFEKAGLPPRRPRAHQRGAAAGESAPDGASLPR